MPGDSVSSRVSCDNIQICSTKVADNNEEEPVGGCSSRTRLSGQASKFNVAEGELDSPTAASNPEFHTSDISTSFAGREEDNACLGANSENCGALVSANGLRHDEPDRFPTELPDFPALLLLGTGAAAPSQYRNVSGMVLAVRQDFGKKADTWEFRAGRIQHTIHHLCTL